MPAKQNYQNHVRYFPLFHFVLVPLLVLNLLYQSVRLYQEPNGDRGIFVIMSVVFVLMVLAARAQALKVQDRVIRLEETLRRREIIPAESAIADGLPLSYVIALRFASDEELPDLMRRALAGEFKKPKDIKLAIRNWRGDIHRV
jgi:hypothetical protein